MVYLFQLHEMPFKGGTRMLDITTDQIMPTILFVGRWKNKTQQKKSFEKFTYTYRLLYIKLGSCKLMISDGKTYDLKSGDIFFFVPGMRYHSLHNSTENTFFIDIAFDMFPNESKQLRQALMDKHCRFQENQPEVITPYHFTDHELFNKSHHLKPSPHTEHIFDRIVREYERKQMFYMQLSCMHLCTILLSLIREAEAPEQTKTSRVTKNIMKYIHDHITENITSEQVAQEFFYHPNHINRLIKQATGMSFHQYVLDEKLHMAINLLVNTQDSITDIAHALSFNTSSHFSNLFTAKFNCTPAQYRKRYF